MNIKEIEILLDKYFEGETSLAEEARLKEFFCNDQIPEHLLKYKNIFSAFAALTSEKMKHFTPVIKANPKIRQFYYLSAIAAGILLLIGLIFTFQTEVFNHKKLFKPDHDQELAFNQAKNALMMVSVGLNTGLNQVQHLKAFNTAMENVEKLHKFYHYQTLIINPDEPTNPSTKP